MRRPLRFAVSVTAFVASLGASLVAPVGARAGSVAWADDTAARDARALDLFEKSEAAYESGRFADAIALLRESYALKQEAVLLYNMGRAYEGLGDLAAAATLYEEFLKAQPGAQDRGALERRIATLRHQLAEREVLKQQALERDRTRHARSPSAVPWIVTGVGAAGIAAGVVVGVLAGQRNDDAKAEPTYLEADRLHSQATSLATVANVCLIAGGIVTAAGIIWGILDVSTAKSSTRTTGGNGLATFVF